MKNRIPSFDEYVNESKYIRELPIADWQRKHFTSKNDKYADFLLLLANADKNYNGPKSTAALDNYYMYDIKKITGADRNDYATIIDAVDKFGPENVINAIINKKN